MSTTVEEITGYPNLISTCCRPKILWYQTDNAIFLRILLIDVKVLHIKVDTDSFLFRTRLNDAKYFISIKLFGTVIAEKTSFTILGREVKVCLIKAHKWSDWPRLQLRKEKNAFIVVDPDHIVKKAWDNPYATIEERESFSEYKKRMNITIMPPESSESECDSDDENITGYDF